MDKATEIIKEDYGGSRPTLGWLLGSYFSTHINY